MKRRGAASLIVLLLVLALAAAGAAYLYFADGRQPYKGNSTSGSSSKSDADYIQKSKQIHAAVDKALTAHGVTVSDIREESKAADREKGQGKILWHTRRILLDTHELADPSADGVKKVLESALKSSDATILAIEADQYHGFPVKRIDIGWKDKLGGDVLTIITERLYVVETPKKTSSVPRKKANPANKAEIAVVIDDFGYNIDVVNEFIQIKKPITFAVLPFKQYSKDAASKALASGQQVMLHMPMEPLSGADPEENANTLHGGMTSAQMKELLEKELQSLPGVTGINNHQGSKATADPRAMALFMQTLKARKLFFVDSRTNGQSVAADAARKEGIRATDNDLFLDGIHDEAYVKKQLRTAGELALRYGSVTVIGHARLTTAAALRQMIPELEAKGIRFVFVSQLVR
jgi:polysaccharide deacetylase 2 family uncharacterized protein YibQ